MWQKCPVCNGMGEQGNSSTTNIFSPCKTCAGKGIINKLTGLPPVFVKAGLEKTPDFIGDDFETFNNNKLNENTEKQYLVKVKPNDNNKRKW